ncbi:MAG: DUF3306 domain-containing protein [Aquincola sp.]|nr:DUF3306 domain-containing protein [Aquincola sp.]
MSEGDGFLARWSKRKAALREGREAPPEPVAPLPAPVRAERAEAPDAPVAPEPSPAPQPAGPPAPTLDDVAALTHQSDFSRFVAPDVDAGVRNAALKKLFDDPHFNVMDGLDTYIDDYGKPDPIPASMLRKMVQSAALGLFDDEKPEADTTDPPAHTDAIDDQDPAVRLQPDDAAGSQPPAGGTGQDTGRER